MTVFPQSKASSFRERKATDCHCCPPNLSNTNSIRRFISGRKQQHICAASPKLESAGASPWSICWSSVLRLVWIPALGTAGFAGLPTPTLTGTSGCAYGKSVRGWTQTYTHLHQQQSPRHHRCRITMHRPKLDVPDN